MTKRKTLIATFAFVLVLSLALISCITLSNGTNTAKAASAPSYVTVNAQKLYSGYYLESNESTSVSTGATAEPYTYVAWYKDGILTLNGYKGGQITFGGASPVDLTIKLNGENTITATREGISSEECENLVIDADNEATLNINVKSSTETVYGIGIGHGGVTKTGTVTIKGKSTVNINAETSVEHAYGIHAKKGLNIVGSANLSIKNTSHSTSDMSYSISSFNKEPLFNTEGVVTLDNSECAMINYCIGASGIEMKKGTLICKYKTGTTNSYACSKSITTAPEGCVLRENPYYLGEAVIKSGEGHTVTVENGTDYYGKDSNQYVNGEKVYVKADIEGLNFDKWEGTGIAFEDAKQKETSFVMGNEDVTIKAVYDVFAKQPVFERTDENKGSLSVQLNKQVSNTSDIKLVKSTGEEDTSVSFNSDPVSDNFTYNCKDVWSNYTKAGTYKIRVEYNGRYFYSDTFEVDYTDKTPFASVSDVVVNGKTGREITPVSFGVTLTYATFKEIAEGTDVSDWFDTNTLPNGLVARISEVSEGSATITISGTPATELSGELYLTIPKEFLATGNDKAVFSKENVNAKFNIVKPASYGITVEGGRVFVGGEVNSVAQEGATVTIRAIDKSQYVFDKWVVVSGDFTLADENNKETTFVMPESDVVIKATYKRIVYSVQLLVTAPRKDKTADTTNVAIDGYGDGYTATKVEWYKGEGVVSSMQMSASDKFIAGGRYTVVVTVTVNPGYVFVGSSSLSKTINNKPATLNSGAGTDTITVMKTFDVPADPIPEHEVTVVNGILAGETASGTFAEGSFVKVSANDPEADMMFDKWIATGIELSSDQLSSQSFTFTMGTNDVTLTATYKPIPKYTVTVVDGKLADGTTSGSFKAGEHVKIIADEKDGFTFDKWTATGITLLSDQLSSSTITITVGTNDITLTATYEEVVVPDPKHKVTIENGSASGDEFKMGQVVTITAGEAPEGKEFDKWVVVSGGATLADENNKETTFIMPERDVVIKATYKDKTPSGGEDTPGGETPGTDDPSGEVTPSENKGLSGGEIAGIAIGATAAAGIGGFSIFWFAVKKKSFAELIAKVKALFKKK